LSSVKPWVALATALNLKKLLPKITLSYTVVFYHSLHLYRNLQRQLQTYVFIRPLVSVTAVTTVTFSESIANFAAAVPQKQ